MYFDNIDSQARAGRPHARLLQKATPLSDNDASTLNAVHIVSQKDAPREHPMKADYNDYAAGRRSGERQAAAWSPQRAVSAAQPKAVVGRGFKPQVSYQQTYLWSDSVLSSLRNALRAQDFREIMPALLSDADEPGARHSVAILGHQDRPEVDYSADRQQVRAAGVMNYFLPVSHVVEKQMSLEFLQRVYCLAPCLRLVMSGEENSGKHLFSFFQFEIEWRTNSMEEVFQVGETTLSCVGQALQADVARKVLKVVGAGEQHLASLTRRPYAKITFAEALERVGRESAPGGDLTLEDDQKLSQQFDRPFWIHSYPDGVRDSIYHKNESSVFETYDLMLPFGYGELTTGGIRPKNGAEIIEQSDNLGKGFSRSYAAWKDQANIQTAGFGIGVERLLRFVSGAERIQDFVQYHDRGPNLCVTPEFFHEKKSVHRSYVSP